MVENSKDSNHMNKASKAAYGSNVDNSVLKQNKKVLNGANNAHSNHAITNAGNKAIKVD